MQTNSSAEKNLSVERFVIQFLLRGGLIIAIVLILAGMIINISSGHLETVAVGMLDLLKPEMSLGDRLLGFGILALAMTPTLRVVMLIYLWAKEKDYKFMIVSIIVLVTLIISIAVGSV